MPTDIFHRPKGAVRPGQEVAVNWDVSKLESAIISAIARRAVANRMLFEIEPRARTWIMDLTACHANGCPLRLDHLLRATEQDFVHDLSGIREAINRDTGKLEGIFEPRHALR